MSLIRTTAALVAAFTLPAGAGCSSSSPFKGSDFDLARESEVYPYAVRVVVRQSEPATALGVMNPRLISKGLTAEIEEQVVQALKRYRVFSWPHRAVEPGRADLELVVNISAPAGKELGDVRTNGYVWPNLFLWLLAGFPAWLLEDTQVDTGLRVAYELRTASTPDLAAVQGGSVSLTAEERLNFWDRAGLWQYVQQILVPPFLVSSNKDIADASLYEKFVACMQRDIGSSLKEDLWSRLLNNPQGPIPLLVALPEGDGDRATLVLLSDRPLQNSEIVEIGADATPRARPAAWKALFQKEEVESLLRRLNAPDQILALTSTFGAEEKAYDYCYVSSDLTRESLSWTEAEAIGAPRVQARFQGGADTPSTWTPRFTGDDEETRA